MKKGFLSILCFCIVLLTGCWDRTEMQDLAIVTAAAIDRLDDGKIMISVQLFIPRAIASGETGEDPSADSTFVREGTGENLSQAISMLQVNIPRRLFWGQCKIYIFGEKQAKKGLRKEIDFLTRHPAPRGSSFLYRSEGKAKEILTLVPPLERYSGEVLRKFTKEEVGLTTTLRDFEMGLMGDSESAPLPYIKKLISKEKARKEYETIPVINGTAIFKKDKMVGTLDLTETRGLLWLKDKMKNATISIKPKGEKEEITMSPTAGSISFHPIIKGNRWIMKLNIDTEGDIVQNETQLNLMNEDIIMDITKDYEKDLKDRVAQTIEKLQKQMKADVINFGRKFHQMYPKAWNNVKDKWDEKFPEVEVKINVNAQIRRPGYIGPPASLPSDEVKN